MLRIESPTQRPILALDLGTKCGWALMHEDGRLISGTWNLNKGSRGEYYYRYGSLLDILGSLVEQRILPVTDMPPEVYFEDVKRHSGTIAAHVYGGLKAVLHLWGAPLGVEVKGVGVGVIKKHATGKGNASKAMMIAAAKERWGIGIKDDNQADALCLLAYAVDERRVSALVI